MSNTKITEQIFLSRTEKCPFCDAELREKIKTESFIDDKETALYEYGCNFQVMFYTEIVQNKEVSRMTVQQSCSNKTVALETVLKLQHQLNPK